MDFNGMERAEKVVVLRTSDPSRSRFLLDAVKSNFSISTKIKDFDSLIDSLILRTTYYYY
jgi:hypothetical protein